MFNFQPSSTYSQCQAMIQISGEAVGYRLYSITVRIREERLKPLVSSVTWRVNFCLDILF